MVDKFLFTAPLFVFFIFVSGCGGGGDHKVECVDRDGDGYCSDFAPGPDCNDNDPYNWFSCQTCVDLDGDGYRGTGCDRPEDFDDNNPNVWSDCGKCEDKDGDGFFAGCQAYVSVQGPDCDDSDPNNQLSCDTCKDQDGDGSFANCDAYKTIAGPDCDDSDPNNWQSCDVCKDQDADQFFVNCDSYKTIFGPDCDDTDPNNWLSCSTCTDADNDGHKGTDCDISQDCNDQDPNVWSNCGLDTFLLSRPSNPSNSADASFTFTCNALSCSYQCSLDSGPWNTCSSPKNYSGLSDGSHTFMVRAIDIDGNIDPTPASYSWNIDTIAPDTTITSNPLNPTTSTDASFTFICNKSSCSFECNLD